MYYSNNIIFSYYHIIWEYYFNIIFLYYTNQLYYIIIMILTYINSSTKSNFNEAKENDNSDNI